jgi:hypothetical protein
MVAIFRGVWKVSALTTSRIVEFARFNAANHDPQLTEQEVMNIVGGFQAKLTGLAGVQATSSRAKDKNRQPHGDRRVRAKRTEAIGKSVLALPEPRRIRDRDHLRHVAQQPWSSVAFPVMIRRSSATAAQYLPNANRARPLQP